MKKVKYLLQHFDGIWSAPLAFISFVALGYLLGIAGVAAGTYDIGFIQPLLLAACVVIGATNMAIMGIRFTFYTVYKYIYGKKSVDGKVNFSKKDWRSGLTPIQRYSVAGLLFAYFTTMIIIVYLKFV